MPQMSPMNWVFLMFFNLMNFLFLIMYMYYLIYKNFYFLIFFKKKMINNLNFILIW